VSPIASRAVQRRAANRQRAAAERKLEEIARSARPVVVGPWTGGVGTELVYWIPLLNWLTTKGGLNPEWVVAVSRGGADHWYGNVAEHYIDLCDHFSPSQVLSGERKKRGGGASWLDRSAFRLACDAAGVRSAEWLHPDVLWRLFAPRWDWGAPPANVLSRTVHRQLPGEPDDLVELPESYVALNVKFGPSFPDTAESRRTLDRVVSALARHDVEVVLLRPPVEVDASEPFVPTARESVHDLSEHMTLRTNLAVQTRVIRHARVFVSTYTGVACLGCYVGTPTVGLYTKAGFDLIHFDMIDRIGRRLSGGSTRLFRARHVGAIPVAREEVNTGSADYSVRNG
jgi:hypothetical protein